jgi:Flp pilus assembly protein TadG
LQIVYQNAGFHLAGVEVHLRAISVVGVPVCKRELFRLLADRGGAAAVVTALTLPVFVGGLGLGSEVGYWYLNQRKVQNSADVAAYAGAVALRAGGDATGISSAASAAADESGFVGSRGTVTTVSPPTSGAYAGNANAVEVTIQENLPRMFTAIFSEGNVPVAGRAVALVNAGQQSCVLALDRSAHGAVTFIGSTSAILVGCNVHSNSLADDSVIVAGNAVVETPCLSASGDVSVTSGLTLTECVTSYIHADQAADPYADLTAPPIPGTTTPGDLKAKGTTNISPGRYNGMTVHNTVNMAPGVYVIDGGTLKINAGAKLTGSGVTFYLTNGATLSWNGGAHIDLSAPTSGPYAGALIFVDRNQAYAEYTINGDSSSKVNGALYAAGGKFKMNGSSTFGGGCTQIVALRVEFSGNSGVGVDCTGAGVRDIRTSRLVTLVE